MVERAITGPVNGPGRARAQLVQVVNTQTGAVATGTTTTPPDDTIPQIGEGDEYMTLSITPNNTSNTLVIQAMAVVAISALGRVVITLHRDAIGDALAGAVVRPNAVNEAFILTLIHTMTAPTTSATTYRIRIGPPSGTLTFNGEAGARKLGGVLASSITIWEILP